MVTFSPMAQPSARVSSSCSRTYEARLNAAWMIPQAILMAWTRIAQTPSFGAFRDAALADGHRDRARGQVLVPGEHGAERVGARVVLGHRERALLPVRRLRAGKAQLLRDTGPPVAAARTTHLQPRRRRPGTTVVADLDSQPEGLPGADHARPVD